MPVRGIAGAGLWTVMTVATCACALLPRTAWAQVDRDRNAAPVDDGPPVSLEGSVPAWAQPEYDCGSIAGDTVLQHMVLVLRPSNAQEAELNSLTQSLQNQVVAKLAKPLSPTQFGERFGVSSRDLEKITAWLERHGFTIDGVTAGQLEVLFTGTAYQVEETFHTGMRCYAVPDPRGLGSVRNRLSVAENPEIPAAFADEVTGILSPGDMGRSVAGLPPPPLEATYTDGTGASPGTSMLAAALPVTPAGERPAIAIVARAPQGFGKWAGHGIADSGFRPSPVTILPAAPGADDATGSGIASAMAWARAIGLQTRAVVVSAPSSAATDGADLSALYAVDHATSPLLMDGFFSCAGDMSAAESSFYRNLWKQAAAEGIRVLLPGIGSTESGCESSASQTSPSNGLCNDPGATCVMPSPGGSPSPSPAMRARALPVPHPRSPRAPILAAQTVQVADYGPDPTGSTDSTSAFQAAFDAATSVVQIPAGTYLLGCTNPLYLSRNNIGYVGAGEGKTILRSCRGMTVPVVSWSCTPTAGTNCTHGSGPYIFTIRTATPLLQGVDTYYCAPAGTSSSCTLETWHGEFPGFVTLDEQFTFNGAGLPAMLSTGLGNPSFDCGAGCRASISGQTVFRITSTVAPTSNSGTIATFSLPQNMIQAFDARSQKRQTGSSFSAITFDGGCNECNAASFDTGLIDMRNPVSSARVHTGNQFSQVAFVNYAGTGVREDLTDGDTFTNIVFTNAGQMGIVGDSPNNLTISDVILNNVGWQTDPRVVGTGINYSGAFNFGCTSGGHTMAIQNVTAQPSKNSEFVGFGIWCGSATAQTATVSAYAGVQIASFTIQSAGNQLLPVSAFADNMTIHGFTIQGYPDPGYLTNPYMEVAGSNLSLYANTNVAFYFAPIDEGSQVDGGRPVHTHYSNISIHDNIINCTAPTLVNTGCLGIAIGGFQNSQGETIPSYIDTVNIYNNQATYKFGPVNEGNVIHIALGVNEGATGVPVGQVTNVHVHNESVTISGFQSRGGGWSAFATLWGSNQGNANWAFDHDVVRWTGSGTVSALEHLRATYGVVASNVTVQSESTPSASFLTNVSGGSFAGITVLP
jgi:hypothetical protein